MKKKVFLMMALGAIALALNQTAFAQDEKKQGKANEGVTKAEPSSKAEKAKPAATQEELEAIFKTTLTKATMAGRWCSIKVLEDGQRKLGPEKEDKYTIKGVSKVGGDMWLIHARIQYGNK